jgi:Fe-S cluster biosynthesis and repair protein YggX
MTDIDTRIEQFRKMANDDPANELGHFSLGRAYLEAGRAAEAAESLGKALAINPTLSKAYQLVGSALLKLGRRDEAVAQLTTGVSVANDRGDRMPRDEMVKMLQELGAPVPELKSAPVPQQATGEGEVLCRRCGKVDKKLAKPPFRSAFGQQVYDQICAPCWGEAIKMGTKVINELRLPLNDPAAQKVWDQHIREFLNLQS